MYLFITLVLCSVCIGIVESTDYDKGDDADLECGPKNGDTVYQAIWYYQFRLDDQQNVVEWIGSNPPQYKNQWAGGRTVLDTSTGDITIDDLGLADDGIYTCIYSPVPGLDPVFDGEKHTISILVPPVESTVIPRGLNNDWVDRDKTYTLTCSVDPIKPKEGKVLWRINEEPRTDTVQSSGPNTDGTFSMEGKLTTDFKDYSSSVKLDCLITEHGKFGDFVKVYKSAVELQWKLVTEVTAQTEGDAIEGRPYTLKCVLIDGNPRDGNNYVYQWKKGGKVVNGETGSTLYIPALDHTVHNEPYTCAADNTLGMGEHSAEDYTINVLYPPEIQVTIPASVVKGYTVTLECRATGGNPLTLTAVQWKHNGTNIGGGNVNNPSLTLQNIQRRDAGTYICILSNQAGPSESQAKNMDVLYAPEGLSTISISTKPRTNVYVGESVDFTCTHPGDSNPPKVDFTFYEEGKAETNSSSAKLRVSYYNVDEGGKVSCMASNEVGHAQESNTITITVEANATIEKFQVGGVQTPVYNDPDVYLDCLGAGNQRTVSWKKEGQAGSLVDWKVEQEGTETGDYTFKQTEAYRKKYQWKVAEAKCATVNKHNGNYTCQVDANAGGKDTQVTQNWTITVQYPPLPTIGYYNPSGAEAGGDVNLTCDVCSFPEERTYSWSFNGTEVGTKRTLLITNIDENGFGNYSCTASNTIDGDVRTAVLIYHVRARGGPSAVQDLDTAEVTSQTVNVTFIPGFNGGLKQNFTVEYKLETDEKYQEVLKGVEDPNPTDPDEASGPRISVNARVGDLDAGQTYTFRVRSENDFKDENKRYSPWAYVNASTLVYPVVSLSAVKYHPPSEGISARIDFSWKVVKGKPESLTLKYRLDTKNAQADGSSNWTVMVEDVDPIPESYSDDTSENLDPKKAYRFSLVTVEAEGVEAGSDDYTDKNSVGSNIGVIIGVILVVVLLVGIIVGAVRTGKITIPKRKKAGSSDSALVLQTVPDDNEVPGVQNEYVGNGSPYASVDELPLQSNSRNPPAVLVEPAYEDVNNDKPKGAGKRTTAPKTSPPAPPGTKPSAAGPAATSPAGQGPIYATANPKGKPKPAPKPQVPAPNEADEEEDPYGTAPPIPDKHIDGDIYSPEHWEPGICIESEEGNYVRVIHHGPSIYIPSSTPDLIYDTIDFSVQLPKDEDSD